MKDFIILFFQISLYGIYSLDKNCIKIANIILNSKHSHFINSKIAQNRFFYQTISEEYLKIGIIDRINSFLPTQIQSTELLMYLINIYSKLSQFIIKFDFSQLLQKASQSLLITVQIDHDTFYISQILDLLRDRLFYFIENQSDLIKNKYIQLYTDTFLPIISTFLISESFEQRINIFNEIDKILNDRRFGEFFKKSIALYFTSDEQQTKNIELSFLANMKFHKEYKNSISSIFSSLSLYGTDQLNNDVVRKLWINNQNLSSSDHFSFFRIFLTLADHDDEGDVLTTVICCILNNNEFTDQNIFDWFEMIDFLIQNLESRHTSVKFQIEMVRHFLWTISFQSSDSPLSNFIECTQKVVERARQSLTKIINVEPNEDDFSQIIEMLNTNSDPFLYILLNEFLKDPQLPISEEEIQSMINQTMVQLMDEYSNSQSDTSRRTIIYDFFLCLCKFSNTSFNDDQIDKLCNLQEVIPNFFSLLLQLSYSNTIDEFDLEKIIDRINPYSINKTFYKFIKKIIVEVNGIIDSNIRILPLKHENILWHFATADTKIRNLASKFLCKLYSLNDGVQLNDKVMIDTFFEHWFVYYSNCPNDDHLLNLLKMFIQTIELQTFRDPFIPTPHQYSENDFLVHVQTLETTINISVPPTSQVGMIVDKVSIENKIEMNSFELFLNDKKLKRNDFLNHYSNPKNNEINLKLVRTNKPSNRNYHHRTHLPSISFIKNTVIPIHEIFEKLCKNNKNAFDLLQVLPTLPFAPDFKDREKGEIYMSDLDSVFDTSKPLVFFYNLETLLKQNMISTICQKYDFIEYLYGHSNNLFKSLNEIENKNELIDLLIVFLKRVSFIINDNESKTKVFYLFVKCIIEIDSNSEQTISMIIQIIQQANSRGTRIAFPSDDFHEMFDFLLMNENLNIRNISVFLFNYLVIPMTVFINSIEKFGNGLSVEFIITLDNHFNDDRSNVSNEVLSSSILSLLENSKSHFLNALLSVILKFIQYEIISDKDKLSLLKFLIKRFLVLDFDENDRIAFNNASECISHLTTVRNLKHQKENKSENENALEEDYNSKVMSIIDNCDSNKSILKEILNLHHNEPFFTKTLFSRFMINGDECAISPFNQVGLKNVGMTCYVNAILQQFYALKPLRNAIMSYSGDHPLLSELSHLFFLMKYAKTKFIDPSFMIEKWEVRPNELLNPRIQQDAAEMIQFLLHVFENGQELKETVNSLFVGQFSHPIDGIGIDYHTETTEAFDLIELEVQECADLNESFSNLSKPELFLNDSQYYAEDLEARINAKRSTLIQKAPPIMIVHLMRFYYNYQLNKRNKITNRFTIFKTIDISCVCTSKEKMIYSLVGVIIHKGGANSGHYISFVRKKKSGIWLCFDDENVTQIDESEVLSQGSGSTSDSTGYILFYEKDDSNLKCTEKVLPSENILNEIDQINKETRKAKLMCSSGYFKLMQNLCLETSLDYLDICLKYTVDTLPFTRQTQISKKYFNCLRNKLHKMDESFKKGFLDFVLDHDANYLIKSLFYCPYSEFRRGFSNLLLSIFDHSNGEIDPLPISACAFQIVDHFWDDYQHSDDSFKVLYELHKKFQSVKNFAIENNWRGRLCNIFNEQITSFRQLNPELTASYIFKGMDLTHYLKLIVAFDIKKCSTTVEVNSEAKSANSDSSAFQFDESVGPIMSYSFFLYVCLSSSSPSSVARFTHKYFSVKDFLYFLQGNATKLPPFRIVQLMYFIMPSRATFDVLNFPFKAQSRDLVASDIIVMMIALVSFTATLSPKTVKKAVINEAREKEANQRNRTSQTQCQDQVNDNQDSDKQKEQSNGDIENDYIHNHEDNENNQEDRNESRFEQCNKQQKENLDQNHVDPNLNENHQEDENKNNSDIQKQIDKNNFYQIQKKEDADHDQQNDVDLNNEDSSTNDIVKSIIEMSSTWLPGFLYDDNRETRNLCVSLCAFLAPCDLFDANLFNICIPNDLDIPEISPVSQQPINNTIISRFQHFLSVCFESIDILNEKISSINNRSQFQPSYGLSFDDDLAVQFLSLVSVLLRAIQPKNGDFAPLVSLYITITKTSPNPFNEQSLRLLMMFSEYSVPVNMTDLLSPFLCDDIFEITKRNEEIILESLGNFLPPFFQILEKNESDYYRHFQEQINDENGNGGECLLEIPDSFMDFFFRIIVFQSIPIFSRIIDDIYNFLKSFVSKRKSIRTNLLMIIDQYFESLIINNYWGLCLALNALGESRPGISDFLPDNIDELKNCNVDLDTMVQMAITSSLSHTINKKKLDEMINKFRFNEKTMKMLLSLSFM